MKINLGRSYYNSLHISQKLLYLMSAHVLFCLTLTIYSAIGIIVLGAPLSFVSTTYNIWVGLFLSFVLAAPLAFVFTCMTKYLFNSWYNN